MKQHNLDNGNGTILEYLNAEANVYKIDYSLKLGIQITEQEQYTLLQTEQTQLLMIHTLKQMQQQMLLFPGNVNSPKIAI